MGRDDENLVILFEIPQIDHVVVEIEVEEGAVRLHDGLRVGLMEVRRLHLSLPLALLAESNRNLRLREIREETGALKLPEILRPVSVLIEVGRGIPVVAEKPRDELLLAV